MTIAIVWAIVRSELSERVLRFALVPALIVTLAMGTALVASFVEAWLLSLYAPLTFSGTVMPNWIIADVMMTLATGVGGFALWRGLRARNTRLMGV